MIRGLIFDLDGTLVNSSPGIALALNHSLADFNLPTHPEDRVRDFIGDGVETLVSRALGSESLEHCDAVVARFKEHYPEDWKKGTEPYPGILDCLQEFYECDIPMAVLSNKPQHYTVDIVKALFPDHLFQQVWGHRQELPRKPDPSTTLQIVKDWGFQPQEVAYVGDSTVDLATAKAGGLLPLIFDWGYGTPEGVSLLSSAEELSNEVSRLRA